MPRSIRPCSRRRLPPRRRPHVQLRQHRHRHLDERHRGRARQRRRRAESTPPHFEAALARRGPLLTKQIARDGEGAEKLIEVHVDRARDARRRSGSPRRSSTHRSSRPPSTAPIPTGAGWRWRSASAATTPTSTRSGGHPLRRPTEVYPRSARRRRADRTVGVHGAAPTCGSTSASPPAAPRRPCGAAT